MIAAALDSAAFIGAFFTGLTTLRHAAASSAAIQNCGRFLSTQPPGRRYVALTLGGQMFSVLLNYGAITLLGSLALANAESEPDAEIRAIRTRRMLLAIQRGFVAILPWSPLAFSTAISLTLVPGAAWSKALPLCLGSGAMLFALGWALDTIQKPRRRGPPVVPPPPEGGWSSIAPLLLLLAILISTVTAIHETTGIPITGIVVLLVPTISGIWIWMQDGLAGLGRRTAAYAGHDLLGYSGEIVLLMMAGFIGTLGAALAVPLVEASGFDLSGVPAPLLLAAMVWIVPLTGQLGMNPILSVSIMAPLLPTPAALGVDPAVVVTAITAGWAISGASSPFTATTLMVGHFGGVSARHVGLGWNGLFTLLAMTLLSGWVALLSLL